MGIQVKTPPGELPGAAIAVQSDTMLVELHAFARYVVGGVLYERGIAYRCSREQGQAFLEHECEGIRPFRLFKRKIVRPKIDESPVEKVAPTVKLPAPVESEDIGGIKKGAFHVGDDSEIADLLPKDGDDEVAEV